MGLGTWKSSPGKTKDIVLEALTSGACKHIDSAPVYQNQKEIGEAIEAFVTDAGGKRDEIHVTSKLMTYALPPEEFEEETTVARVKNTKAGFDVVAMAGDDERDDRGAVASDGGVGEKRIGR